MGRKGYRKLLVDKYYAKVFFFFIMTIIKYWTFQLIAYWYSTSCNDIGKSVIDKDHVV